MWIHEGQATVNYAQPSLLESEAIIIKTIKNKIFTYNKNDIFYTAII